MIPGDIDGDCDDADNDSGCTRGDLTAYGIIPLYSYMSFIYRLRVHMNCDIYSSHLRVLSICVLTDYTKMYKLLCGKCGKRTKEYRFKVGKPEGKTPGGKHRRILEDNIKTDLKETAWYGVTWSGLGSYGSGSG